MGLLDKFKGAAGDLVQGAKDKVTEATGVDADKLYEAAGNMVDSGESMSDAVDALKEGRLKQ